MDIRSMSMERLQASYRSRHPLDWVIMNARQEEEAAAAAEAVEKTALAKARQQREDADVKKLLRRQGGGSPGKRGGKSPGKRSPGKRGGKTQAPGRGSRRPVAGVEEEAYTVFDASADASAAAVRQQAQLMAGTRTTSFTAAQQLFNGRVEVTRRYPHDMDQSALRRAITAPKRIGELNAEVQAARERRAEKEAARVADVELAAEDAVGWQPDGGKLRLGRIGQPSEWDYSGELFKRGQVATWKWTRGFFVLYDGLLYEFTDSSLAATVVAAWPCVGSVATRTPTSTKAHPYLFQLRIAPCFEEEDTLALTQFAAPGLEERAAWLTAIDRISRTVQTHYRSEVNDTEIRRREEADKERKARTKKVALALLGAAQGRTERVVLRQTVDL